MTGEGERIIKVNIEEKMKTAYIDYSMSVIVSRALPDVRDGLKPVHRRVLYGMSHELGLYSDKETKKSARIVGEVLGKFHPHGDSSVYEAMVRMAQWWSLRYPLVYGQGNFGSNDGDRAAAMRYTEAKMEKITDEVLADIDKDTVDFQNNFDESILEPTVLPTRIPLLLVNGSSGIAVGMATNMPPHNLGEVVDAICAYIDNPEIDVDGLMHYVKGPDFPTGGIIYGVSGIREAYETGRGRVVVRAKTEIEHTASGRECIVITEIPYMVNKSEMLKKIADLANEKKIEGISYVNDESDQKGMRGIIILKHDAVANVVLNNLFKYTPMQTTFAINNIALVDKRPMTLGLKDLIKNFVDHRHEIILRRTRYELAQAMKRVHILEGLLIAQQNIDEVINIIKTSPSPDAARQTLMARFGLSEEQATAILEMRLRQLTALEHDKLQAEHDELEKLVNYLNQVLSDEALQMKIIRDEMVEIREKYADERRTEIIASANEFNPEDFYANEDVVITISHLGYIKRTSLTEYRTQNRGGVGVKGSSTRDEDFIEYIYIASMHDTMLLFTEKGRCHWLKVYDIPEGTRASKGRAVQNVINIAPDDRIRAYLNVKQLNDKEYAENHYVVMCTANGIIKKTSLEEYSRPRTNGVNAITVKDDDMLLTALITSGNSEILMAARNGKAIRFHESNVRSIGRTGVGVKGIELEDDDRVVGMIAVEPDKKEDILVVSENGYGKRSEVDEYRITNRGGKGVKTINITEKTGHLVAIKAVSDQNDLMIINKSGITIRLSVDTLRIMGRATQGVRVINLRNGDSIASVAVVPAQEDKDEQEGANEDVNETKPETEE